MPLGISSATGRRTLALTLGVMLAACADSGSERSRTSFAELPSKCQQMAAPPKVLAARSTEELLRQFETLGYDLDRVRRGSQPVPRVLLAAMPADLAELGEVDLRKRVFLTAMLPAVMHVNAEIRAQRRCLKMLSAEAEQRHSPDDEVLAWIEDMALQLGAKPTPNALLKRLGEVSPSLALAQAAIESGWGTSRFARNGNALFGQYTSPQEGGMTPEGVGKDSKVRIAAFDTVIGSVRSYAANLNTHQAYEGFRRARAALAATNSPLDGLTLAGELLSYSERGEAYVRDLRTIIRQNGLHHLDDARFAGERIATGYDAPAETKG